MSHSILTVDDSKTVRMVVKRVFSQYDCVICEATNGEEGLAVATQERPDIILLDLTMPIMDGTTMLAKLKADSTLKDIPVIMLTAEHGQENVVHIISLGVRDYLVKPFKDEQLREKVQKVLPICAKNAAADTGTVDVATAAEFGRAAVPESVKQLGKLIGLRDATLGDYAQIISQDVALTERLLRSTNARAAFSGEHQVPSVEAALQRVGITFMLLLAISDPLLRAIVHGVHSMLGIDLAVASPDEKDVPHFMPKHMVGEAAFTGKTSGIVHMRLPFSSIALVGERLRGSTAGNFSDAVADDDVVGALCTGIFGTFEANLRDAGLMCTMGPLTISSTSDSRPSVIDRWVSDRYGFRAKEVDLLTDLSVNSFVDYSL